MRVAPIWYTEGGGGQRLLLSYPPVVHPSSPRGWEALRNWEICYVEYCGCCCVRRTKATGSLHDRDHDMWCVLEDVVKVIFLFGHRSVDIRGLF